MKAAPNVFSKAPEHRLIGGARPAAEESENLKP
jgi:hypothetical protein